MGTGRGSGAFNVQDVSGVTLDNNGGAKKNIRNNKNGPCVEERQPVDPKMPSKENPRTAAPAPALQRKKENSNNYKIPDNKQNKAAKGYYAKNNKTANNCISASKTVFAGDPTLGA
ncbi:TBC1 domain family member 2A [Frankliniella fusca]|uniref:TBC1 domain family member 2A n=1 Tax=Frankliniella fusca TaxID=407009 RepID=A0AAE1HQI3_9NEOP|nr:TBC1 domain family member 2A [Frankliniella fusca]